MTNLQIEEFKHLGRERGTSGLLIAALMSRDRLSALAIAPPAPKATSTTMQHKTICEGGEGDTYKQTNEGKGTPVS